ncbi:E3 ubiquitin-protein ligase TRAIP-like [Chelonus insularis]|uniref:E3 ubiquitin-protein ligase TRAIP-like n=1 Tax=Chelonus insularis TaxID=460826 RepID=UPI00158A9D60|nr:E3 ubiquitin-protein ligase TRAIP-like [Chelonus insularis]
MNNMNGQCSICYASFEYSDELCSPHCGHVFHFTCLREWLERSKTCPECRRKTDGTKIHPIYIQMGRNSIPDENLAVLQELLSNLESEIKSKDTDLNHYKNEFQKFKNQAIELRKEVHNLEVEINLKKNHIATLQEQNKYLKDIKIENETLKNNIITLEAELKFIRVMWRETAFPTNPTNLSSNKNFH